MPAPVCDGSPAGAMGWGGVELAGFNTNQMGGWIDGQMDGQTDIASAFISGPHVAGPFLTCPGLCSHHPRGRAGGPGAAPASIPPAAWWLSAAPAAAFK